MANHKRLERLNRSLDNWEQRSLENWNQWRKEGYPDVRLDRREADLRGADLRGAYLKEANFSGADLIRADLSGANLIGADLREAYLSGADLSGANLSGADLRKAHLGEANLRGANLRGANLKEAYLIGVYLIGADLSEANFTNVGFGQTIFMQIDLSNVKGLETASHNGPSAIHINSVILPTDERTRNHFLAGIGFTETQIEYLPSLLTPRPIQYHSLFISFTHQDQTIAERLHTDFRKKDIPCWFAPHELTPGDYYRHKIDEAINRHDKLILILSEHSIKSQWVKKEVETALKREESMDMARQVLFPIRLDDTIMTTSRRWISGLRYHRHIGDFTGWQEDITYQQAFTILLQHLKVTQLPANRSASS